MSTWPPYLHPVPSEPPAPSAPPSFAAGQVVTVFRSRLRPGCDVAGYLATAAHMLDLARAMPGFVDYKSFGAEDGERVSLVTFADAASQAAWREHAEHRMAQDQGRASWYAGYSLQVGACDSAHQFTFDD